MLERWFIFGELPINQLNGWHDWPLQILSFALCVLTSYVALNIAGFLRRESVAQGQWFWITAGGIALGVGLWAKQFTGMLAYHYEMEHHFVIATLIIGMALSMLVATALYYLIRGAIHVRRIAWAAPLIGLGFSSIQYINMQGMAIPAALSYISTWFLGSLVFGGLVAAALMRLAKHPTLYHPRSFRFKLQAAILLSILISAMHYCGLKATVLVPFAEGRMGPDYDAINVLLGYGIGILTTLILGLALAAINLNQRLMEHLKHQVALRTEQLARNAEELQLAKEQAEEASLAKTEFLANMSHEIRTPINAVVGIANILNADMLPPEKHKQYLTTLQVSAESLLSLINELLDISKIEINKIELEQAPFNLRELIAEVIMLISVRANEKGLNVTLEYDERTPEHFIGDSLRVRQVLVNLLSNAVKFTAEGGIIIHVSSAATRQNRLDMRIRVSDTGIGIPTDKLEAIFDKFIQADSSHSRQYGGTGLGLAISRGLAERMNGEITVASQPGKGSVFTFRVPLAIASVESLARPSASEKPHSLPTPVAPEKASEPEKAKPSGPRILLVEDNAANILVAKSYLELFGFTYAVAHHGEEGVEKHVADPFDIILMDVQMPVMDGYEATQRIRDWEIAHRHTRTPIIAMTSHGRVEDRDRCLRKGMDDYLSKPFRPEDLKTKILAHLDQMVAA